MASIVTRIAHTNLVDATATVITGSTEVTNLEDDNVQDEFVALPWRTTSDTDENIVFDLGSALPVTMCGIFGHNLTSAATVDLAGHTANSWGSPDYGPTTLTIATDGLSYVIPKIVYYLASTTLRYWRLRIQDAANPDGYIEIGRVWLGTYITPTYNFSNGFTVTIVKPDKVSRAVLSGAYGRSMPSYEELRFSWAAGTNPLPTADRDTIEALWRLKGRSNPFFMGHDVSNRPTKSGLYGYFTMNDLRRSHGITTNFGTEGLIFREDVGWNGN